MMRVLVSLIAIAPLAIADDTLTCAIDGAGALDSAVGAAVYLWASTQRCASGKLHDDIKCEIDVTSAAKAVNDMVNTIVGAVNQCGAIHTENAACGQAVGSLTSAAAGLATGAGGLAHWIAAKSGGGDIVTDATTTTVGKCVVDVKGAATSIFSAAGGIEAVKKGCGGDNEKACATNALQVISILGNMGSAIAHSVAHCTHKGDTTAAMSGDIIGLVAALDSVASAGIAISQTCKVSDARLYSLGNNNGVATTNNFSNLILAAFLPVAAVIGFVGGRRLKKAPTTRDMDILDQSESEQA